MYNVLLLIDESVVRGTNVECSASGSASDGVGRGSAAGHEMQWWAICDPCVLKRRLVIRTALLPVRILDAAGAECETE